MKDPIEIANKIRYLERKRGALLCEIEDLVKSVVEDYHFLDFRVSTFWTCEKSPMGMCVFSLDDHGQPIACRYCQGPPRRQ